jgi:membrane protein YdbS with pleckstrin-like domain
MRNVVAETTLLNLRPTRLIALKLYIAWIFLWILSAIAFLDPTRAIADSWQLLGFKLQTYLGAFLGLLGLAAVLYAEFSRLTIRYTVTDSRIVRKDGIIRRKTNQMPFNKIERVELDQGLIQRMFNLGDIVLDTGEDTIVLQSLGNVEVVQEELSRQVAAHDRKTR